MHGVSLSATTVWGMAQMERKMKRCLEIGLLGEIDVETVSFADTAIIIKNDLRKEE